MSNLIVHVDAYFRATRLEGLTPQEIGIRNIIIDKFKDMSSAEISAMSHKEDAWKHGIMKT